MQDKRDFVVSGINFFEGGPLSIYKDCLQNMLAMHIDERYNVIAFVHKKELFSEFLDKNITFIELPKSRKNYLYRCYYEYSYFYRYSKKRDVYVWLSLHDMTPNVVAERRFVYCHNVSPFLKRSKALWKTDKTIYLMSIFYKYVYGINIKKNTGVIVQQNWIRKKFEETYGIGNVIVSRPSFTTVTVPEEGVDRDDSKYIFIFASFPRPFKNFEVICEATKRLTDIQDKFEVWLTIDGSENAYSKQIVERYGSLKNIKFLGLQKREQLFKLYKSSDCLIFPSQMETWGMPISEYKCFDKPMILADLPYAHETLGDYSNTSFFNPYDAVDLSKKMSARMSGKQLFQESYTKVSQGRSFSDWIGLINYIIEE